jgi:hypothetical protein
MKQVKQLNRVELAAAEGSITAQNTLKAFKPVIHASLSSRVAGTGNRPPGNKNVRGDTL